MKIEFTDELLIQWGDEVKTAKIANGFDNINNDLQRIKIILEGDNSYNPVTINIKDVLTINGNKYNR